MSNEISIYGHELIKSKLNETDYKISVIRAQKFEFSFLVTSIKESEDAPIKYQLKSSNSELPRWTNRVMDDIFQWLSEN